MIILRCPKENHLQHLRKGDKAMTGYDNKYGAYMTKEDKRLDLISHGRKSVKAYEKYTDPTSRGARLYFAECLRVERLLATEHGMTEDEIWVALHE